MRREAWTAPASPRRDRDAAPAPNGAGADGLRVLLVSESTYPYFWGGVSTWCDRLIRGIPEARFTVMAIVADTRLVPRFELPPNVEAVRTVPIWGVRETHEWRRDLGLRDLVRRRRATNGNIVHQFVPALLEVVEALLGDESDPVRLASAFHSIYLYSRLADFDAAMRSPEVTHAIIEAAQDAYPALAAQHGYEAKPLQLAELTRAIQLLCGWLSPLAAELPPCDVAHAAMSGLSSVVAVVAKLDQHAGFLLTEHGVYLRERYLAESASSDSLFLKLLAIRFARRTTEMAYWYADLISPCCDYNQRWELRNGASSDKLRTIYYGVDADAFQPAPKPEPLQDRPVVVWAGRINPLKDVETLLRAAAVVHTKRPDVQFRLHGSAPAEDRDYYEGCLELRKALDLEDAVEFCGFSPQPAAAYNEADVVVLSSISEGFPNCTLEAMLCGKPVVATAVGGIREQLGDTGLTVEPRNPEALGEGILALITDPEHAASLGRRARDRAVMEFHPGLVRDAHVEVYQRLADAAGWADTVPATAAASGTIDLPELEVHELEIEIPAAAANGSRHLSLVRWVPSDSPTPGNGDRIPAAPGVKPSSGLGSPEHAQAHADGITVAEHADVATARSGDFDALVDRVVSRIPLPVDTLEVAAVLESMGITDPAAHRYGFVDTFALADATYTAARARRPAPSGCDLDAVLPRPAHVRSRPSRVPIAGLFPPLLALLLIQVFAQLPHWGTDRVLAVSTGVAAAMLVASTCFQALTGRTSAYLARDDAGGALRAFVLGAKVALVTSLIGAGVFYTVARGTGWLAPAPTALFAATLLVMTPLWFLAGALSMMRAVWWVVLALASGLATFIGVDHVLAGHVSWHVAAAAADGAWLAAVILVVVLRARLSEKGGRERGPAELPRGAFLVREGAGYAAQGGLLVLFLLVPFVLGWVGTRDLGAGWMTPFGAVQRALTLSMAPALIAGIVIELSVWKLWDKARALHMLSGPGASDAFARRMRKHRNRDLQTYLLTIAVATVVFGTTVAALDVWVTPAILAHGDTGPTLTVFCSGLAGFALVGYAQLQTMMLISLAHPGLAARAELAGIVVTVAAGVPLALVDYRLIGLAFVVGAATFAALATHAARGLTRDAYPLFVAAV